MVGLTMLQVKHAGPGRHPDGNGLYLHVRESGSRAWVLRVVIDGKRRDLGLGPVDRIGLAQARDKAATYHAKIRAGEDLEPAQDDAPTAGPTFAEAARVCHEALKPGWRNGHHSNSWLASLERHIFPHFGDKPVDSITSIMVRDALAPIWLKIPETSRRTLHRIRTVLDFAHIEGWCPNEASLRSVRRGLPRQPIDDNHFESMRFMDVPEFFTRLGTVPPSPGKDALMFTILNAVRSGETRLAKRPNAASRKIAQSRCGSCCQRDRRCPKQSNAFSASPLSSIGQA